MQLDAMWSLGSYARMDTWAVMEFPMQKAKVLGTIMYYLRSVNLFSFTRPTKCNYNIHNRIDFYDSNLFRYYYTIIKDFLSQVLKLVKYDR